MNNIANDSVLLSRDARGIATITLNRPQKRNAFDDVLIGQLHIAINEVAADASVRAVILTGAGTVFSAGADLEHMRRLGAMSEQENYEDALRLANCLQALDQLNKPVIARVNGSAYGGGIGLIACADIAIAVSSAQFALTEVRLGIVPAVISPYVLNAIGARNARWWFLTAMELNAIKAQQFGLIHAIADRELLDEMIEEQIALLLQGAPNAQCEAKSLVRDIAFKNVADPSIGADKSASQHAEISLYTARLLARLRGSPEGKEGLTAVAQRRPPSWRATKK